jgi:hypothetical protein
MVMGLLVAPGAMFPVSNEPSFAVAVCVMLSALRHATVCPGFTDAGFGEKEFEPFIPVIVMVTSADPDAGGGAGDVTGVGEDGDMELLPPHATSVTAATNSPPSAAVNLELMVILQRAEPARNLRTPA